MELFCVDGCHDFIEQTSPENRARINEMLKKYKECVIEYGDNFTTGIELNLAEVELTDGELKAKRIKYKHEGQKNELQRLKKEWEDR